LETSEGECYSTVKSTTCDARFCIHSCFQATRKIDSLLAGVQMLLWTAVDVRPILGPVLTNGPPGRMGTPPGWPATKHKLSVAMRKSPGVARSKSPLVAS
jgi:hypothetical protein